MERSKDDEDPDGADGIPLRLIIRRGYINNIDAICDHEKTDYEAFDSECPCHRTCHLLIRNREPAG